jgi:hypothetical protein
VYLGGWGRSGSTLLGNVLNEMDGLRHVGELTYVWETGWLANRSCGCGEPFQMCAFWKKVVALGFSSFDPEFARRAIHLRGNVGTTRRILWSHLRRDKHSSELIEYASIIARLYHAIGLASGTDIIVDSSKLPIQLYPLLTMSDIDVMVLHLVRDPRASAYSWSKDIIRKDGRSGKSMRMERLSVLQCAMRWTKNNLIIELLGRRASGYHRVQYEQFTRDPERVLDEICRELRIGTAPPMESGRVVHLNGNHTAWGNPSRSRTGPTTIRHDDAWETHFPILKQLAVALFAWPAMLRYGYVRRREG